MKVGIVGLGLIGGSLAKAYKDADVTVFGIDKDDLVTQFALMAEAIDERLDDNNMKECDLILVAINPVDAVKWFREKAPQIGKATIVIDCCGTKRTVCRACFEIADEYGLTFMGGHPMAGKERGGFKHSSAGLFRNAPFILVPKHHDDMELMCRVKEMIMLAGFGRIGITTSEEHDKVIAFTSQMPHIISNGFIKSETALDDSQMISAGSYQDFTRVAYLDEKMWTQLFMENRDFLSAEIRGLIGRLTRYEEALEADDPDRLMKLLAEGKACKTAVLKKCGPQQINGE
ncbi:prephenate dehydrogenase [Aminicella lysinilytica]|uniref:prephenate dehydrogenase n=1 Tax=Aminicella lysinilytica TaxID=433323 RepID=UPI0026EDC5B7|nr:prephenate dehydrogenase/arogenate dehydrogenase family protein [Aminicella lysinilytica]